MNSPEKSLAATIAFGFVMTMSSGFGQTFFVSLFNPQLREAFALSHGDIGGLYFLGTLLSAATVIWLGKLIDQIDLRLYTCLVTIGLAVACLSMATVSTTATLVLAFFLLRLFGQGLSGHTGITTASRVSAKFRGRSVSLSGLGYSAAEIILPFTTIVLISQVGWRHTWTVYALVEIFLVALVAQFLLRKVAIGGVSSATAEQDPDAWNRLQVIRDRRFWKIAPALFSPSIISTALFFHQESLGTDKGYTLSHWATGIAAYSITAVLTSLATGVLVDRFSGATVVRFYLLPFTLAVLVVALLPLPGLPYIYYGLIGATVGIGTPSVSALWLELYGATHIGAIRALTHACMVFGTALGPALFGYLLDAGVSWNKLLIGSAVWMILVTCLLVSTKLAKTPPGHTSAIASAKVK